MTFLSSVSIQHASHVHGSMPRKFVPRLSLLPDPWSGRELKKFNQTTLFFDISIMRNEYIFYIFNFQEEEKKFIATLAENSAATEEELLHTIKNFASGECLFLVRVIYISVGELCCQSRRLCGNDLTAAHSSNLSVEKGNEKIVIIRSLL